MWQEHPSSSTPSAAPAGEMTSVGFAEVARQINRAAASLDLTTPAFRSPPRRPGVQRSIARRADGSATVSVALRGRPAVAVVADMIDGVLAATPPESIRPGATPRDRLWSAAAPALFPSAEQPRSAAGSARRPLTRPAERPAA